MLWVTSLKNNINPEAIMKNESTLYQKITQNIRKKFKTLCDQICEIEEYFSSLT